MTLTDDSCAVAPTPPESATLTPVLAVGAATLAAIVVGLIVGAVYRQGAFYPLDAFGLVLVSVPLVVVAFRRNRDRHGVAISSTVGGLVAWWLIRSIVERSPFAFLPLGASLLGFLAAMLVVRSLERRDRARVAMAVVAIGALNAATGVAGVLWRWHPLAQEADGFWRVSTTLTYPAAAAALFIMALLMAMALDLRAPMPRAAVCLCLAGLIGTQSRWDLLALACGALVVPRRRWSEAVWPLAMGSLAGLVVLAAASGHRPGWPSWAAVAVAVGASAFSRRRNRSGVRNRLAVAGVVVVAGFTMLLMVHPPFGRSPRQSPGQSQTLAWSASAQAWRTSVLTGVGPPRTHTTRQPVATYPGSAPDGYLTIGADGGLLGGLLLLGAGAAVAASFRRRNLVSSCGAAAAVAFAIAGAVDFDWQLPALGLVGGCVAGLASGRPGSARNPSSTAAGRRGRLRPGGAAAAWTAAVVVVVTAQLLVGVNQQAGGALQVQHSAPPKSATPERPGRIILSGQDPTDPFMLKVGGQDYLYTSEGTGSMNAPLRIGSTPGHWGAPIDVLPNLPGWAEAGLSWAPDVHAVKGGWALYFTALLKGVTPFIHCIGSAFASSPAGPFVPTARPFICQLDHRGSIDARVFVDTGNRLVMLWKSEDNANPSVPGPDQNGYTGIYAQDLSANGRVLLGRSVKIFAPSQPWEGTIVEAPDMIQAWGTYWLFFSGNWYNSASYGIGVAACQSPFGPCSDPNPGPFLGSNQQGIGPGESSLFRDGQDTSLLYNPFRANDPGPVIPRPVAMTRLGFAPSGPYLAAP